ncbi:MAG: hypothetical protein M1833_001398 [Piccolia ochrophora]|nr:MAG: hypothetical protein M1833_001398 [Piccolia ochrophora]
MIEIEDTAQDPETVLTAAETEADHVLRQEIAATGDEIGAGHGAGQRNPGLEEEESDTAVKTVAGRPEIEVGHGMDIKRDEVSQDDSRGGAAPKGPSADEKAAARENQNPPKDDMEVEVEATEEADDDDDGVDPQMKAMMGFGGFGTTKQKKIAGNDAYSVRREKKTEYRQYMNRIGGFNRPLSPSRD